jgi:hypothetical protein
MMKLTLEIFQEPELPNQWTSHCVELDIFSAAVKPEVAIEAVAEAVRMVLRHEMKRHGLSCTEAFEAIAREVAARRPPELIDVLLASLEAKEAENPIESVEFSPEMIASLLKDED